MKRWKSPQTAARLAARAARKVEQHRRESWKSWLLVGSAILAASAALALYSWSYIDVHRKAQHRHQQRLLGTNSSPPLVQSNSVTLPSGNAVQTEQP